MGRLSALVLFAVLACLSARAQEAGPQPNAATADLAAPLPEVRTLLAEVERNQKHLEATQRDYTYHVHSVQQELGKDGGIKKTETTDAESLTVEGVRVDKVVARNGTPLTPAEQQKESERLDRIVAKAKERKEKASSKDEATDPNGNAIVPLSRVLELGTFSHEQRVMDGGRAYIVLDYTGNADAKTRNPFETLMRDIVGKIWIDEADRVLVRGEGHFVNDFKIAGGLFADVHKGSSFAFRANRVEGVWLPAEIQGEGTVRVLLFAHFNGRLQLTMSDYRRFRTSSTILSSHGAIDDQGNPVPEPHSGQSGDSTPGSDSGAAPHP